MKDKDARQAEFLANRLAKRQRQLSRWARREGLDCFRLYDVDIPEIPLAVDRYGKHLVMSLYERPYEKDPREEDAWLSAMAEAAAAALAVERRDVHVKLRKRQRGESQYAVLSRSGVEETVREGGLSFIVNLSDYLDTGLFLDHRPLRARVRELSAGKRVLNLFCYTGSFSVYAASGGASSVTSVDLSSPYLAWAERNFSLNGIDAERHRFIKADALAGLREARGKESFGVIVLDPPTFSNSKAMSDDLDVSRDHGALIARAVALLEPGGTLFFSTNARRFRLDESAFAPAAARDITEESIPVDFRDRKIHRAWEIRR